MRRFLLIGVMVGLFAGQASAALYYQMDATTAAGMRLLSVSAGDTATLDYVGYHPGDVGSRVFGIDAGYGGATFIEVVGFSGQLKMFSADDSAIATIGLASPTLSGTFDGFLLPVANDNNQTWRFEAYVTAGATVYSAWAQLAPGGTAALLVNTGSINFSTVTGIGFDIEWKPSLGGNSASDDFHASVVPVPAAFLLGLLGMGVAGLKLRRFA